MRKVLVLALFGLAFVSGCAVYVRPPVRVIRVVPVQPHYRYIGPGYGPYGPYAPLHR